MQAEEGEALLVACASIDVVAAGVDVAPATATSTEVHLKEDKLFVQLGDKAGNSARWILDTGATNHMTGERTAFSELDTKVHGTVRFGDGRSRELRDAKRCYSDAGTVIIRR